jgi:hypothetical protein
MEERFADSAWNPIRCMVVVGWEEFERETEIVDRE